MAYIMLIMHQVFREGHSHSALIKLSQIRPPLRREQTTMPTVNQTNAARQQGDNARAGSTQNLLMQQNLHNFPPHALKTPLPLPRSDAYPSRLEESMTKLLLLPGHLLLLTAAWQRPGNERRSQRESEGVREPTINHCRTHIIINYQYNKHNMHLKMGHCIKLHTSQEQQCSARLVCTF